MIAACRILISHASYRPATTWTACSSDSTVVVYEPNYVTYRKPQEEINHENLTHLQALEMARYNAEHNECPFVESDPVAKVPSGRRRVFARSARRSRRINLSELARPPPRAQVRWINRQYRLAVVYRALL